MTGRLADRVAVITGAGDGIGEGTARRFAAEGAKVLVAERDPETDEATAEELRREFDVDARFVRTDVAVKEDNVAMIETARQAWGTVHVLMNNAWGGGRLCRVEHKTDELFDRGFHVGFYGPSWAMQAAFPLMKAQGHGRIINVCSLNGVNAHVGTVEYNSAKEALRAVASARLRPSRWPAPATTWPSPPARWWRGPDPTACPAVSTRPRRRSRLPADGR